MIKIEKLVENMYKIIRKNENSWSNQNTLSHASYMFRINIQIMFYSSVATVVNISSDIRILINFKP